MSILVKVREEFHVEQLVPQDITTIQRLTPYIWRIATDGSREVSDHTIGAKAFNGKKIQIGACVILDGPGHYVLRSYYNKMPGERPLTFVDTEIIVEEQEGRN